MTNPLHRSAWFLVLTAMGIVLFLDQLSKSWAQTNGTVTLNHGVAFGIPVVPPTIVFLGFATVVVLVGWQTWRHSPLLLGIFLGGAASNVLDRIMFDGVRDWLPFLFGIRNNLADWAVVGSLLLLAWSYNRGICSTARWEKQA